MARVDAVFVDEAQFLRSTQVDALAAVVDELSIPVLCYGLRTDFRGVLFEGAARLFAIADEIRELKTICWCGRKATMNLRTDGEGRAVLDGAQVGIGGNELYTPLCRRHYAEATGARPLDDQSSRSRPPRM
ncbi:MAG: thymidine kinase, partial [Parvularculaceae bacterium]|nr:thymidine kinase [Parvularculaceae bacterium]